MADGSEAETKLTKVERTTRRISQALGDTFTEADVHERIDQETTGTDYYHETYLPRVVEHEGVVPLVLPNGQTVYAPPETRADILAARIERDHGTSRPLRKRDIVDAIGNGGIDVSMENRDEVQDLYDAVVERLDVSVREPE